MENKTEISPEEQKANRDRQRKLDNEKAKRQYGLKKGDSIRSCSTTPVKKPDVQHVDDKIIVVDFKKKKR